MSTLTYHGMSKDICQWVVETYKNDPLSKDNETVQQWIKDSEEQLKALENE